MNDAENEVDRKKSLNAGVGDDINVAGWSPEGTTRTFVSWFLSVFYLRSIPGHSMKLLRSSYVAALLYF